MLRKFIDERFGGYNNIHYTEPSFANLGIGCALCIIPNLSDPAYEVDLQQNKYWFGSPFLELKGTMVKSRTEKVTV